MDVTDPEIVFVEGRRYRILDGEAWSKDRGQSMYEEESYQPDDEFVTDECNGDQIVIESTSDGNFKHEFYVPKPYFPFIIGVKHATRKKFESDTATSISIPKLGQDGNIVIRGRSRLGIISARRRIDLLIESSTKSLPVTHFLSIPMFGNCISQNFNAFKEDVLRNSKTNARGVDKDIFQEPHLLHLTLVVLVLLDEKEHKQAIETFNACETEIVRPFLRENGPISIKVQGVDCMNDDPSDVNVLYAKIQTKDDILNKLVDKIYEYFFQTGLTRREYKTPKLHMTIMNSSFKFKGETQPNYRKRKSFDATEIIKAYKDTFFGEVNLESIHLSQRGTSTEDHYYRASAEMNLKDCY